MEPLLPEQEHAARDLSRDVKEPAARDSSTDAEKEPAARRLSRDAKEPAARDRSRDLSRDPEKDPDHDSAAEPQAQDGVRRVEAITQVWSRAELVAVFILLYLVTFVDSLLQSVQGNLVPYVTSSFAEHALLSTTGVVATVVGGVCNLTIAKIIDIWGRCEGFLLMAVLVVVGMVLKATTTSVNMYAAAHTIYWVGHLGLSYIISIMLADMTTLRNRLVLFGIQQTPTIASTFAGPAIADLFYTHVDFRWAFGAFSIILAAFCLPVAAVFLVGKRRAVRQGLYPVRASGRSWRESLKCYVVQFDAVGMFLTVAGWSLLLLPFSIATSAPNGWQTGYIIAMLALGLAMLAAFGVWEKRFAPVSYFPWDYLGDRTILGACLVYAFMFASIFAWDTYYGSYLQAVNFLDITISGYVLNSFALMSAFISPIVGLTIRYTGDYKWLSVGAVPFAVLGTALLIKFRTPDSHVGLLVMCQLFNGLASGIWAMTAQLAIMARVHHQHVAVALAMFSLFGSIGASVGQAIAGAIWTNLLPARIAAALPPDLRDRAPQLYGNLSAVVEAPRGSPERDAVIDGYAVVQRYMVIAGSCFLPLCLASLLLWKNVNVRALERDRGKQTKGAVF